MKFFLLLSLLASANSVAVVKKGRYVSGTQAMLKAKTGLALREILDGIGEMEAALQDAIDLQEAMNNEHNPSALSPDSYQSAHMDVLGQLQQAQVAMNGGGVNATEDDHIVDMVEALQALTDMQDYLNTEKDDMLAAQSAINSRNPHVGAEVFNDQLQQQIADQYQKLGDLGHEQFQDGDDFYNNPTAHQDRRDLDQTALEVQYELDVADQLKALEAQQDAINSPVATLLRLVRLAARNPTTIKEMQTAIGDMVAEQNAIRAAHTATLEAQTNAPHTPAAMRAALDAMTAQQETRDAYYDDPQGHIDSRAADQAAAEAAWAADEADKMAAHADALSGLSAGFFRRRLSERNPTTIAEMQEALDELIAAQDGLIAGQEDEAAMQAQVDEMTVAQDAIHAGHAATLEGQTRAPHNAAAMQAALDAMTAQQEGARDAYYDDPQSHIDSRAADQLAAEAAWAADEAEKMAGHASTQAAINASFQRQKKASDGALKGVHNALTLLVTASRDLVDTLDKMNLV